jgi:poly(hydroxyalkanoate) depolymerase family esterase
MSTRCTNSLLSHSLLLGGLFAAAPAGAASLQQLPQSEWWAGASGLPGYVNMYLYVPDQRAAKPPVVVAPHHCQGTGPGTFGEMSSLVSLADQSGFILIFPEATGQNCWDAGSARSLTHDGKGDTHAIVQMVRYTLAQFGGNPARVYSVGGSSGGMITEALLGVYPDVFMAGVSYMGVPAGCWASGYNDVVGKPANGTGQWSGPCAGGNVMQTGEAWGALARSFFPGYVGHRPRLQHWHGTADTTINPRNLAEDIKQWTNVLGLSETPTGTDTPASGTTRQYWQNACGYTVYETFSLAGVGHAVPFNGSAVAAYFGLGDANAPDPETVACPDLMPGTGIEPSPADSGETNGSDAPSAGATPSAAGSDGPIATLSPSSRGDAVSPGGPSVSPTSDVGDAIPPEVTTAPGALDMPTSSSSVGSANMAKRSSESCALAKPGAARTAPGGLLAFVTCALAFRRRRQRASA